MPENQRDRQRLINHEVNVIAQTWDDQQRMRRGILNRVHELAQRLSSQSSPLAPTGLEPRGGS